MVQVIVSPKELRAFGQDLAELTRALEARNNQLTESLQALGSTWADERYRSFSKAQNTNSQQLQAFFRIARSYVQYLDSKANAADRYLGR